MPSSYKTSDTNGLAVPQRFQNGDLFLMSRNIYHCSGNMATDESNQKMFTGDDAVHAKLLSHVASHVIPTDRKQFALQHLRMSDTKYEEIEHDNRGNSKAISFEVEIINNISYISSLSSKSSSDQIPFYSSTLKESPYFFRML